MKKPDLLDLEHTINNGFEALIKAELLKAGATAGDITPRQTERLEKAITEAAQVIQEIIIQNQI